MEGIRVLVIAPYSEIQPLIEEVLIDHPIIHADIFVGSYEEAVRKYPWLLTGSCESGVDIVVARGYTAEQLIRASHFPVVEIETSLYDTLRTIKLAQERKCRFAIMGSKAIIAAARQLITVLRLDSVPLIDITSKEMALTEAQVLKKQGISLIVGDLFAIDACHLLGIDSILISSGKASLVQTFLNVEHLRMNLSAHTRRCALYRCALQCSGNAVYIYNARSELIFSTENSTPVPDQFQEEILKYLPQIQMGESVSIKRTVDGILYRLSITRTQQEDAHFIVHVRPYGKGARTGFDDFLRLLNPLECFDGDIMLSNLQQLFPIHNFPRHTQRDNHESVMLYGASGTGKEYLACEHWRNGIYSNAPLLILECSNLTPEKWSLLTETTDSLIYDLDHTLLLKNIHQLAPSVQHSLNAFLDQTCYRRNHRIICTSDVHLGALVSENRFLSDLYHKVAEYEQYLPTLNEKPEHIKPIIDQCITQLNVRYNTEVIGLDPDALALLENHQWKNNIEQLQDVMRHLVLNSDSHYISAEQTQAALERFWTVSTSSAQPLLLNGTLAEMEAQLVRMIVNEAGGHYNEVAKRLGISRTTLWRMLKLPEKIAKKEGASL